MSDVTNLKSDDYTVRVSTDALAQAAGKLRELLERLNNSLTAVAGRIKGTAAYWEGTAADEIRLGGEECAELTETAREGLLRCADDLEKICGSYYRTETESQREINELPSSVIS